jgi:kynurenine formamidase
MVGAAVVLAAIAGAYAAGASRDAATSPPGMWGLYESTLKRARYIDLTHVVTPHGPVWKGFGPSTFKPAVNPETGKPYTYAADGFEATAYSLATDQLGTQLDPPAHWAPEYPAIDELPATYAVRPLVVISIVGQVAKDPKHALSVADVRAFERRHILFHGHEPLDTDTTPTLEGEAWLMHHGYAQAEGVTNLGAVAPTGCLVSMGFPRLKGGLGGYARFVAICPPGSHPDARISGRDAPLPKLAPLHFSEAAGYRVR